MSPRTMETVVPCTTLRRVMPHVYFGPEKKRLLKLLNKGDVDDETLPFSVILKAIGFHKTLHACRAEPKFGHTWREFALWCAEQTRDLMVSHNSIGALDTVRLYLDGRVTKNKLTIAHRKAKDAYGHIWADAWDAPWSSCVSANRNAATAAMYVSAADPCESIEQTPMTAAMAIYRSVSQSNTNAFDVDSRTDSDMRRIVAGQRREFARCLGVP